MPFFAATRALRGIPVSRRVWVRVVGRVRVRARARARARARVLGLAVSL